MKSTVDIAPILAFLACPTPRAWVDWALQHPDILLIDHANCEKKAASTALNLMYRYVEHHKLLTKLSRLAREELRHFEQVIAIIAFLNSLTGSIDPAYIAMPYLPESSATTPAPDPS